MNKQVLINVLDEYAQKREYALEENKRKIAAIYSSYPILKAIDDEIASSGLKLMKASLDETEPYDVALERIKKETEELKKHRKEFITKYSINERDFEPYYECPICEDKGFINNVMCSCLKKAVAVRSYRASGLGAALESQTFDNFNLTYYIAGNSSEALAYMKNLFSDAKDYAFNFDGSGNILMIGGTGLGKTHLSSAIAKTVIGKGYTVVYESAQKIFDIFEDKKFGRDPEADTSKFSDADLLIIDDLGTENVTQFTVSVLYNLINERCNNCKGMIINTNLTPDELRNIYKPRIFSRLFGDFKLMHFKGKDIRLQKLGEK